MNYQFTPALPADITLRPYLISGSESILFHGQEFLLIFDEDSIRAYKIRHQNGSGPFKDALMLGSILVVGFKNYMYLYDTIDEQMISAQEMDGYFGYFYTSEGQVFVTDASSLYCIDRYGETLWKNDMVGIDGVIVDEIKDSKIYGRGDFDPPGDWRPFIVDKRTGKILG